MAVRSMQSTLHMPSRGYGPTLNAHTVPTVHANASPWEAGSSLFRASSLSDWLRPEAAAFPGLHLPRRPSWPNYQVEIDQVQGDFRAEGDFGALETTVSKVEGGSGWDFEQAADDLLGRAKLPQDLLSIIKDDICQFGSTVASLCPWSKSFIVKLELMGEDSCPRWHMDSYCGRGIVTYNLAGTEYATDDIVDFWELEHCGNNDCIIKDKSKIRQVNVGDLLFMKGKNFPGGRGLVHRSPDVQYQNGAVLNRLVLKVDVP